MLRIRDTDPEVKEGVADAAAAATVQQQLKIISYLARLRDDGEAEHMDRIQTTRLLMGEFKEVSAAVVSRINPNGYVDEMDEKALIELAPAPEDATVMLAR